MYGFIHVRIKHKLPKPKERPDSFWLYSWGAFGSYVNTVNAFAGYKAIEYLNADNWKENTEEVDHWKVQHYRDEFGFLQFIKEEDGRDDYYIDTKDGEFKILEADERFLGTYNWFNADNFMMHTFADVIPYIIWGNTPDDMENTIVINRIYPIVETYEDSKRREYLERNRYKNIIEGYKKYYSTETK